MNAFAVGWSWRCAPLILGLSIFIFASTDTIFAEGSQKDSSGNECSNGFTTGQQKLLPSPPAKVIQISDWNRKRKTSPVEESSKPEVVSHARDIAVVSAADFVHYGELARGNVPLQKHIESLSSKKTLALQQNLKEDGILGFAVTVSFERLKTFFETGIISKYAGSKDLVFKPLREGDLSLPEVGDATIVLIFDRSVLTEFAQQLPDGSFRQDVLTLWPLQKMIVESELSQKNLVELAHRKLWPTENLVGSEVTKADLQREMPFHQQLLTVRQELSPFDRYYIINPIPEEKFNALEILKRIEDFKAGRVGQDQNIVDPFFWLNLVGTHFTVKLEGGDVVEGSMVHFTPGTIVSGSHIHPSIEILNKDGRLYRVDFVKDDFLEVEYNPRGMGRKRKELARSQVFDDFYFQRRFKESLTQPETVKLRILPPEIAN